MPKNHPAPRRLLALIALVVLIAAAIPAVSAEIILQDTPLEYADASRTATQRLFSYSEVTTQQVKSIQFQNIELYDEVSYISIDIAGNKHAAGEFIATYTLGSYQDTARIYVVHQKNILGQVTHTRFTIFPQNWDASSLSGVKGMVFSDFTFYTDTQCVETGNIDGGITVGNQNKALATKGARAVVSITAVTKWTNALTVSSDGMIYNINLNRYIDNSAYVSTLTLKKDDTEVFSNTDITDQSLVYNIQYINIIELNSGLQTYTYRLDELGEPGGTPVKVYVRNSQTGALLADAHIEIQDTTTDPWTEVVNQTLTSGQGTISLAKDPGIHLTQYRIGVTVPGYQQVVPALFFRVVGPTNVVVEMEPVEGGPVNEDNAYLEFYVRDLNANGIPNANVLVDGQLRWTNAQGYTQIEVAKNASYPYSVSKSGYVTIEGTATTGPNPRYVVNVVLGPGTVPTYTPTLGPGETPGGPGATPTPDTRTNEQKGQAIIDLIADFAEPIAILAILATIFGLMKMMTPGRR